MKAGRELDALIAEKVMEHDLQRWINYPTREPVIMLKGEDGVWGRRDIPHYSTQIADAWLVVEKFRRGQYPHPNGDGVACCVKMNIYDDVAYPDCYVEIFSPSQKKVTAIANEMPLAICLAALKTKGE